VVADEMKNTNDYDITELISKIEAVESRYSINYADEIMELRIKESDYNDYIDAQVETYIDDHRESDESKELTEAEEAEIIHQIFNSLLDE
jgi:hypothetical protein